MERTLWRVAGRAEEPSGGRDGARPVDRSVRWAFPPAPERGTLGWGEVLEMETKQWNVQIVISEDDEDALTVATATLSARDGKKYESVGHARRNPGDRPVPAIGDELAVGRALSGLAAQLIEDAAVDVAQMAGAARGR